MSIAQFARKGLLVGISLEILVVLLAWMESSGQTAPFFQSAARISGRVSLLYFGIATVYATLYPGLEVGSEPRSIKYLLFRDFALIHFIHWFFLAVSVYLNGFALVPARVAAGSLAYILTAAFPWLLYRQNTSMTLLRRMQGISIFWIWFIFMMTYVTRLQGLSPEASGSREAWIPLAIITLGIMIWRLAYPLLRRDRV